MFAVHYYSEIDASSIGFGDPKKIGNRHRSIVQYGKDKTRLYIQTPRVLAKSQEIKGVSYLDVTINDKQFLDFLVSVDEQSVQAACDNSKTWFGKQLNPDIVRRGYRSPMTVGRNGAHLLVKFQYDEYGEIATRIFDEFANRLPSAGDEEEYSCALILELNGVWFGKSEMRCEWSVAQIKIYSDEDANVELQVDSETEEDNTFFAPDEIIYEDDAK